MYETPFFMRGREREPDIESFIFAFYDIQACRKEKRTIIMLIATIENHRCCVVLDPPPYTYTPSTFHPSLPT